MKFSLSLLLALLFISVAEAAPAFRFHLISEPSSLKPWEQKNSSVGYLLSQVSGTLLSYQDHKLIPNLAQSCIFKTKLQIQCKLKKDLKWSDGSPLLAADFVRAFQSLIDPEKHAFRSDLLFPIKNAELVFSGKLPKERLKVSSPKPDLFMIELETSDPDFLYTLASPLLAPIPRLELPSFETIRAKPDSWLSSGAYRFLSWEAQKKITLLPNPYFWKKNERPNLEIISVPEDSVALSLYEKGELSFLRRLPTLFIPKFKARPDFFEIEQLRFDYIGFSAKWKDRAPARQALASSIRFNELQSLYHSRGLPGCPGIPASFYSAKNNQELCHAFDLEKAKKLWAQAFPEKKSVPIELLYSKQGGDDHKRTMEFLQSEWLENIGAKVQVAGMENKLFLERLKSTPPDLFRKGVAPERPTCLSTLQTFESKDPENIMNFSDPKFDETLKKLRGSITEKEKKTLCNQALHLLIDSAWLIPTGPIHFTLLANPEWTGWKLNELNQLDLSELHYNPPASRR